MAIKDVVIPQSPPKGGKFVFEVKFNGKEGSWILNAPSEVSLFHIYIYLHLCNFLKVISDACMLYLKSVVHKLP